MKHQCNNSVFRLLALVKKDGMLDQKIKKKLSALMSLGHALFEERKNILLRMKHLTRMSLKFTREHANSSESMKVILVSAEFSISVFSFRICNFNIKRITKKVEHGTAESLTRNLRLSHFKNHNLGQTHFICFGEFFEFKKDIEVQMRVVLMRPTSLAAKPAVFRGNLYLHHFGAFHIVIKREH
jgi:hypothetical protein